MVSEDSKAKAAWQFKRNVSEVLKVYDMYGMGIFEQGVVEEVMELAVQLAKRFRGIDVPISHELAKSKLKTRHKGK